MRLEYIIFYIASVILFVLTLIEAVNLEKIKKRVRVTTGKIVTFHTIAPEGVIYNSKWATISYFVDGKPYISENRIQVPMSAEIGDYQEVKYLIDHPQTLISYSDKRFYIFLIASGLCMLVGYLISRK